MLCCSDAALSCLCARSQHILEDLRELRVATSRIAKDHAVRAKAAASAIEARDCMVEGIRELEGLYNTSVSAALSSLADS